MMVTREITVQRLLAGTVFKLVGIGLACSVIPLSLLTGLLAMGGASTLMVNRQIVTGMPALVLSPLAGALMVLVLTLLLGSCMALGLWLFSKFRPMTLLVLDTAADVPGTGADKG